MAELSNVNLLLKKHEYISFDVFDTLIKRSVAKPTDLFLLMENHLAKTRPGVPSGFAQKRQDAERRAKEKQGVATNLQDIYRELRGEYGEYTEQLMTLETEMELRGCQPNPKCVKWFDRCVSEGKTVVLISDMYLPAQIIGEMLNKCGIHGYQKLYVSCECGARKRDGSLFKIVLKELNIRSWQFVHIGDNRRGDLLAPACLGICAVWVRNDQKKLCKIPKDIRSESELAYRTLCACIRNCSQGMTEYEKIGCENFGPQLYGFTQWLAGRLKRDGIEDVYFLAREGYMLKRAFDALNIDGIRTNYLYCSRRAFQVPLLWFDSDLQTVVETFVYHRHITLRRLLLQIGLDPEKYCSKARECGLEMDRLYKKKGLTETLKDFYALIREDVIENAGEEYVALMAYFRSLDLPKKFALVDTGFRGTIQYCMEQLLNCKQTGVTVKGYYFSASKECFQRYGIIADGYLYRKDANNLLFEAQFLSEDGSLRRFDFNGAESIPVFENFEYEKNDGQLLNEVDVIREYQTGAVKFIKYMQTVLPTNTLDVDADAAVCKLNELLVNPSLHEARFWGDFRYINYTRGYLAHPRSLFTYVVHPKALIQDFRSCGWPTGFMRRLFRAPLPYDAIINVMKKFVAILRM